jgi:hypothetical protein
VIDGGVLDNEPFLPVLAEIARRPVQGPLDRVIAYIVPALGEVIADLPSDAPLGAPGVLRSAPAAFTLPRGMSTLDDLDRLERLAETANTDRQTRRRLLSRALGGGLAAPGPDLFQLYRERRRDSTAWEIRKLVRGKAGYAGVYLRTLPESGEEGSCDLPWLPAALDKPVGADGRWAWGVSVASRFLRSLMGIVRDQLDSDALDADRQGTLEEVVSELSDALESLGRIDAALAEQLALALSVEEVYSRTDDEVNSLAVARFHEGVADGEQAAGATLAEIVWRAATAVIDKRALPEARGLEGEEGAHRLLERFLWAEVYERVAASPEYTPTPRFRFYRFGLNPRTWFLDSTLVFTRKLMGLQVSHFGAFFKDEWRAYDWTWGRLDGASHLVNMLVTRESLERALSGGRDPSDCLAALVGQGSELREAMARFREAIRAGDDEAAERRVREVRELLVRARHSAILRDELPTIAGHWEGEKPEALALADETPPDGDEGLRAAWTAVCHHLGGTSALGLASHGDGREILGRSVASFLRAVSLDDAVPGKLRGILRWIALGVRGITSSSLVGTTIRIVVVLVTLACLILAAWPTPLIEGAGGTIVRVVLAWLGGILSPVAVWVLPGRLKAAGRFGLSNVSRLPGLVRTGRGKLRRSTP